jgi:type II secretory pathway pseudopilin PulG
MRARRGLTFLEVVLASVLLGMLAATAVSAMSYVIGTQERAQRKLQALEVASRLMMIYLDDPSELKALEGQLVPYAGLKYRWSMEKTEVTPIPARLPEGANANTFQALARMDNVRIRAWLSEESGGAREPEAGVQVGTIVRLVDPAPLRNPDSLQNAATNRQAELIQSLTGRGRGTVQVGGGRRGPSGTGGGGGKDTGK